MTTPVSAPWPEEIRHAMNLAHSLLDSQGFDPLDQAQRLALWNAENPVRATAPVTGTDPGEAMAGQQDSLLKLAPLAMFFAEDPESTLLYSGELARSHADSQQHIDCCRLLGLMLLSALHGEDKQAVLAEPGPAVIRSPDVLAILSEDCGRLSPSAAGSRGVAVLEASLRCFRDTRCFSEAILRAMNVERISRSVCIVTGQIAGAYYGFSDIPRDWRARVSISNTVLRMADQLNDATHPCCKNTARPWNPGLTG